VTYNVSKQLVVANNDVSVVRPSPSETLTLITCTGTWLPLQRDYNERTIVVAMRLP
jgi:sortase (surface protein transpeptidase)